MDYNQCVADSNFAFSAGNFESALASAKKAISIEKDNPEAYYCAGKAQMSIGNLSEAIEYFKKAISINGKDGNGYFLLGYAQAMENQTSNALESLTKALELNCKSDLKGQIYRIISMINIDNGDYDNALINLEQAEDAVGLDIELLEQKAACYASKRDYHQTIFTLNQIKLLNPRNYKAYSLAFNIFMETEIYEEALAELERAEKFAELTMDYYNDRVAYTLLNNPKNDTKDNIKNKWISTLKAMQDGMDKGKPTAEQVFELYLRAAQLYISLENPGEAVNMLNAAANPVTSFNNHFTVYKPEETDDESLNYSDDMLSPEDEEMMMQEKWENGEFDEIRESVSNALYETMSDDPEEISEEVNAYLSPIDAIPSSKEEKADYVLSGEFHMEPVQYDMRNSMYIAAYEMLEDYESMLLKARELQSSSIVPNQYSGIYYELKYGKYTNKENWQKKYRERISFWTKRMLEDPTDFISASYRIRSYIDIGDFENAELLCACLPTDVKESLMQEISNAKSQGGGENGDTH